MAKIYTKFGDEGTTYMGCDLVVSKDHPTVKLIGSIDELQSILDICRLHTSHTFAKKIKSVQDKLRFFSGEILGYIPDDKDKISSEDIKALEEDIDMHNKVVPNRFVKFNTMSACYLNEARVRTRNVERRLVSFLKEDKVRSIAYKYINRLSDWLFVLAYIYNNE